MRSSSEVDKVQYISCTYEGLARENNLGCEVGLVVSRIETEDRRISIECAPSNPR